MEELDWESLEGMDPCEVLSLVRPRYRRMVAGEGEQEVEIDGRRVKMSQAAIPRFEKMVNQLEAECREKQTGRRRRSALGSRHYS